MERVHPGILGGVGMAIFATGLFLLSTLPADASNGELLWRLMLCGAGFGFFQTPNNSTLISSAPSHRSGGASGMLGMARLLGQSFGTTLAALLFGLASEERSTRLCLVVAGCFALVACVVSSLRISQPSPSR